MSTHQPDNESTSIEAATGSNKHVLETTLSSVQQDDDDDPSRTVLLPLPRLPISCNIQATADPCVVLVKAMISKYADDWTKRSNGKSIYSLAQGVVYWKPPEAVQTALIDALVSADDNLHLYGPDEGLPELRDALQTKIAIENGLTNHNVMITTGANQAYMNCVLTLLNPSSSRRHSHGRDDDNEVSYAVVFAPYYFNHVMALQMTISPKRILVGPIDLVTGQPDLDWLTAKLDEFSATSSTTSTGRRQGQTTSSSSSTTRIRMVTLVNPGNPTGICLTKAQVQPLVDLCRRYGVWLVLDATYEYFVHCDNDNDVMQDQHEPLLPALNNRTTESAAPTAGLRQRSTDNAYYFDACFDDAPHCIHIFSFSKAYALAGYRCGYLAISRHHQAATVFAQMLKVQDTIPIAPSRIAQVAALAALTHENAGPRWVQAQVATLQAGRTAMLTVLQRHALQTLGGSGAMYIMGQLPLSTACNEDTDVDTDTDITDVNVAERLVREFGVAVIPGSYCGFCGWIRVCYANLAPHQCLEAAQRLDDGLAAI